MWTPSLRNTLGFHYRVTGYYSRALRHSSAVWEEARKAEDGTTKEVADFALAQLTRLLASLGRKEQLAVLFEQTRGRRLDQGPLEQLFEATKEGYLTMVQEPGRAYRCGTLALARVIEVLSPGNAETATVLEVPSPEAGFSLGTLQELAARAQLSPLATERVAGEDLVVPSVVHWKLGHNAAITDFDGKRFKVEDPTLETTLVERRCDRGGSEWLFSDSMARPGRRMARAAESRGRPGAWPGFSDRLR